MKARLKPHLSRSILLVLGINYGLLLLAQETTNPPLPAQTPEPSSPPLTTPPEKAKDHSAADPMGGEMPAPKDPSAKPEVTPLTPSTAKEEESKPVLPPITPENANLNLPSDLEIPNPDPEKVLFLPAGTYRQILQFPIDSPRMRENQKTRDEHRIPVKVEGMPLPGHPGPPKPTWVRYESLEKIKIGNEERRGGIDLPANGPPDVKPRLWYAKSEDADVWSSLFYFIFGGIGYGTANLAGWSAGNTRELPNDFEYRLIRK